MWFDILKKKKKTKILSKRIREVLRPYMDESIENLIRDRDVIHYADLVNMIRDNKEQYLGIAHREIPEELPKTITRAYNLSLLQLERLARSLLLGKGFFKSKDEVNDARVTRYIRGD